jgi:hypothetical protein
MRALDKYSTTASAFIRPWTTCVQVTLKLHSICEFLTATHLPKRVKSNYLKLIVDDASQNVALLSQSFVVTGARCGLGVC